MMTMSILIILMVMQNNIQYYSIWGKKEHVCGLLWMKGFLSLTDRAVVGKHSSTHLHS